MHSFSFTPLIPNDTPFDWKKISKQSNLSEDFLLEHAAELDWKQISRHSHLSSSFIEEEIHRFHIYELAENPFIKKQQLTFHALKILYSLYWNRFISITLLKSKIEEDMTHYRFSITLDLNTFPEAKPYETIELFMGFYKRDSRPISTIIELTHKGTFSSLTNYTDRFHTLCSNSYQLQAIHFLLDETIKTCCLTEEAIFSY